jgi:hypothetical protein
MIVVAGVVALIVAVLIVFLASLVRRAVAEPSQLSVRLRPSGEHTIEIEIATSGAAMTVTEISMKRTLYEQAGMAPPEGFVAEALPLTPAEQRDPEAVERASDFNRETVRYVGTANIPPKGSALLVFQVQRKDLAEGVVNLQHVCKVGLGGVIGFASFRLDPTVWRNGLPSTTERHG